MEKKLTVFEGMCIIAGYGIGSGVMLLPYYVAKVGLLLALVIMFVAFAVSVMLHLMIAELSIKSGENSQVISIFEKYLFKGKGGKIFTWAFFGLMLVTLLCNLAIYISGSSSLINNLIPVGEIWGQIIFYVIAAGVVFFGLKIIGICEKYAIMAIMVCIGVLAIASFFVPLFALPLVPSSAIGTLTLFAKVMFVFVAFFSVPQVVNGLKGEVKKIRISIIGGIGINMVVSLVIVIFSLAVFPIPEGMVSNDYMAMVAWSNSLGQWAKYFGTAITLLAFMTTFWSISLALSDIVKEQLKLNKVFCWLIATLPALIITLLVPASFETYINLAGGVIAILIVVLLIPAFRNMIKTDGVGELLGKKSGLPVQLIVVVGYLLMAVGSVI